MTWRSAKSLIKLREQINAAWPNREKASDGTIGDARHQKSRSDHNPNRAGVVQAMDIDKDLSPPFKIDPVVNALVASRDPRIKYLIWRGQILSSQTSPWTWRKYTGANGHFEHLHISVSDDPKLYDDERTWSIGVTTAADISPTPTASAEPTARMLLRLGDRGDDIADLQRRLGVKADGIFGQHTAAVVKAFQRKHGLTADGIVGPKTLAKLPK